MVDYCSNNLDGTSVQGETQCNTTQLLIAEATEYESGCGVTICRQLRAGTTEWRGTPDNTAYRAPRPWRRFCAAIRPHA